MFEDREKIVTNILVVMFLVSVCTIVFGMIVKDAIVIVYGIVILLGCLFYLWIIKRFRKH